MIDEKIVNFWGIAVKTIVAHSVTYFLMGLLASSILDYSTWFADANLSPLMRQTYEKIVMAGPLFQPIRGFLFAIVFYLLREVLFLRQKGWLVMWLMLVIVGILSTFGPSPGSVEGMVYTKLPFVYHIYGWPEVIIQSLLLSGLLFYWVNHPGKKWLNWALGVAFLLVILLPSMGLLVGRQA